MRQAHKLRKQTSPTVSLKCQYFFLGVTCVPIRSYTLANLLTQRGAVPNHFYRFYQKSIGSATNCCECWPQEEGVERKCWREGAVLRQRCLASAQFSAILGTTASLLLMTWQLHGLGNRPIKTYQRTHSSSKNASDTMDLSSVLSVVSNRGF